MWRDSTESYLFADTESDPLLGLHVLLRFEREQQFSEPAQLAIQRPEAVLCRAQVGAFLATAPS